MQWGQREVSAKRYVYLWSYGSIARPRWEEQKQCLLVLIRADADGNKELVGHSNGYRESEQL